MAASGDIIYLREQCAGTPRAHDERIWGSGMRARHDHTSVPELMPRVIIEAAGRAEAFGRTAGILNGHGSRSDKPQQHARGLGGREGDDGSRLGRASRSLRRLREMHCIHARRQVGSLSGHKLASHAPRSH